MARFASSASSGSQSSSGPQSYFFNPSGTYGTCVRFYTVSNCFIVPSGISSVRVRVWGAGGGAAFSACAGGGGGGFAMRTITGLVEGTCIPVTVGVFTSAAAGGTSSFGSYVSATGGACGLTCSPGGCGLCGDINTCGGRSCGTVCAGGGGGSGNYFGDGGCYLSGQLSGTSGSGAGFSTVVSNVPGGCGISGFGSICCCNASPPCNPIPTWTYLDYYGTGGGGGSCGSGWNGGGWGAVCNQSGAGGGPNPLDNRSGLVIVEF